MPEITRWIHTIGDSPERIVGDNAWPKAAVSWLGPVGLTDGGPGYDMQRPNAPFGHLLASYDGCGEVWIDGVWQRCEAGSAYVSPRTATCGFRTVGRRRWRFAWAYLQTNTEADTLIRTPKPAVYSIDPRPLVSAIEGLYLESTGRANVGRVSLWAELVGHYVREIAGGGDSIDPLWRLWADVDARLAEPWTLTRLAKVADLRPEALRRLARRTIGRSPMRQVTHLRMRRAETLLRSTNQKLFSIARQVGYENAFAFSTAFNRWKGQSPKVCRESALTSRSPV
ncbi:MAG: helix-turn-helix transcriptional regulator [Tepidisphaeraceae bacterium]